LGSIRFEKRILRLRRSYKGLIRFRKTDEKLNKSNLKSYQRAVDQPAAASGISDR